MDSPAKWRRMTPEEIAYRDYANPRHQVMHAAFIDVLVPWHIARESPDGAYHGYTTESLRQQVATCWRAMEAEWKAPIVHLQFGYVKHGLTPPSCLAESLRSGPRCPTCRRWAREADQWARPKNAQRPPRLSWRLRRLAIILWIRRWLL